MNAPELPPASAPEGRPLLAGYAAPGGLRDEMLAAPGRLRPHVRPWAEALAVLGTGELVRRREQVRRLVRESGSTHAAPDAPDARRPWELDLLPLVLAADEWRAVAAGLAQRMRLLNLLLADLYGPQQLLADGRLPPELLFAHPGFLRPCHGVQIPNGLWLHLGAADLARGPDGQWWIAGDRTEAPVGAGYALENRIVVSRVLPDVIRDVRVERLASYFLTLRETLRGLAPHARENPRIVLLSGGPHSPHHFEDAYLARYLGYTLVEGADLAVRNSRVYLKTLGGLLPVEVILRRVDAVECDPLELRGDSPRGVAGLLQAVRLGHVVLVNALGSGLVESPAFLPFLPALCRELLGEDLRLPGVPTWWCGDATARQHVLSNLDRFLIRPAFRGTSRPPVFGDELSSRQRDDLKAAIAARPWDYVAQEPLPRSSAPVLTADGLRAGAVALRAYAVATADGYEAMPGGLVRVAAAARSLEPSLRSGEGSKDAWVLADGPVRPVTLLQPPGAPVELRRSGTDLPSRVADNLFWLGRQAERAEGAARLLRTLAVRLTGEAEAAALPEVPLLVRALAASGQIEPGYAVEAIRPPLPPLERLLPRTVFHGGEALGLRRTVGAMHAAASTVRDRISIDSWRLVNRIEQSFQPRPDEATDLNDLLALLNRLILDLSALSGLAMESMTRTLGWRFLDLGRRIERGWHTVALVQHLLRDPAAAEPPVLDALLEVADSQMTYRSRYLANLRTTPVLDLLLTDETNPRSLAFQLTAIVDHVESLPRDPSHPLRSLERRLALAMLHSLRMVDVGMLGETRPAGRPSLDRILQRLSEQLPRLSDAISHKYLIHAGPPRQLAELWPDMGRNDQ